MRPWRRRPLGDCRRRAYGDPRRPERASRLVLVVLFVVWPLSPRLLTNLGGDRTVLSLKLVEQFAKALVPDLALDDLAYVATESAGASAGAHRIGQFLGHGHAHLPNLALVQPGALVEKDLGRKGGRDALHYLVVRRRGQRLPERCFEAAQRCGRLRSAIGRIPFPACVHEIMLPPVASFATDYPGAHGSRYSQPSCEPP